MSAFEDFVNLELPRRPALLTNSIVNYDGDPNSAGAPAILTSCPVGSLFLEETSGSFWRKAKVGMWRRMTDDSYVTAGTPVVNYYVDASTGSDSNNGLTAGTPFLTIGKAMSRIPEVQTLPTTINIATGTYSETIEIRNRSGRDLNQYPVGGNYAKLSFVGTMIAPTLSQGNVTETVTSVSGAFLNVATANWAVDELRGMFAYCTGSGTGNYKTKYVPIVSNTQTSVELADATAVATLNGTTLSIYKPGVVLQKNPSASNICFTNFGHKNLELQKLNITTGSVNHYGGYILFNNIKFNGLADYAYCIGMSTTAIDSIPLIYLTGCYFLVSNGGAAINTEFGTSIFGFGNGSVIRGLNYKQAYGVVTTGSLGYTVMGSISKSASTPKGSGCLFENLGYAFQSQKHGFVQAINSTFRNNEHGFAILGGNAKVYNCLVSSNEEAFVIDSAGENISNSSHYSANRCSVGIYSTTLSSNGIGINGYGNCNEYTLVSSSITGSTTAGIKIQDGTETTNYCNNLISIDSATTMSTNGAGGLVDFRMGTALDYTIADVRGAVDKHITSSITGNKIISK